MTARLFLTLPLAAAALLGAAPAQASAPLPRTVVAKLRAAHLPVGPVRYYNATTDVNHLLGRPGQYVAKANFRDQRLEASPDFGVDGGGSIETFSSTAAAQARYRYLVAITTSVSWLAEYDYLIGGRTLLRVSHLLTPRQAAAYRSAAS